MSISIGKKRENTDGYMTAGNKLGFGVPAASMTATWIWAASIAMSDIYRQDDAGKKNANPRVLLLVGRVTMILATGAGLFFASGQLNILDLLVFVGVVTTVVAAPFTIGFLHDYAVLSNSLLAYAVSTIVCFAMSVRSKESFDFSLIKKRTGDFDDSAEDESHEPLVATIRET